MRTFFNSNAPIYRCLRTICQGVIGVIIANADVLVGGHVAEPYKAVIVAIVMAILSPVMASLGEDIDEGGGEHDNNGNQN